MGKPSVGGCTNVGEANAIASFAAAGKMRTASSCSPCPVGATCRSRGSTLTPQWDPLVREARRSQTATLTLISDLIMTLTKCQHHRGLIRSCWMHGELANELITAARAPGRTARQACIKHDTRTHHVHVVPKLSMAAACLLQRDADLMMQRLAATDARPAGWKQF